MNSTPILNLILGSVLSLVTLASAQVPQMINYQGRVAVGDPAVNFDGTGEFKFALVNEDGSASYWSNDGTSTEGSEPTAAVSLTVTKGLYSVLLGANMTAIPSSVFANSEVHLRVWFDDGSNGSQLLTPDQRIVAVGYAMVASTVVDGAITSEKIATGAVGNTQLASGLELGGTTNGTFSGDGSGLTGIPGNALADAAITTDKVVNNNITTAKLADAAITAAKLADANITTAKIADGNITAAKLASAAITTAKLADAAITAAKVADANITTAKIADGNITAAKLAGAAITTAKLADANITTAKVADGAITGEKLASDLTLVGTLEVIGPITGDTSLTLDTTTITTAEIGVLDGTVSGNVVNSKAVIYGGSGQIEFTTLVPETKIVIPDLGPQLIPPGQPCTVAGGAFDPIEVEAAVDAAIASQLAQTQTKLNAVQAKLDSLLDALQAYGLN